MSKTSKKRNIDQSTPMAEIYPLGDGRYALNARNGIAYTLTERTITQVTSPIHGKASMKWAY